METQSNTTPRENPEEAQNTDDTIHVAPQETAGAPTSADRTTEEVRQGHTGDHVRYILMASFAGAVLMMVILIAFFF